MPGEAIDLRGVSETMLQTLYARAKETQKPSHYINDQTAVEIVSRLDYDFSNADKDAAMSSGVIARTILLDRMTESYLTLHPGTTVVNIACGLDTRCYRMQGKYRQWYNLDLPETIAIRKRFLAPTDTIRQIACSAMDSSWAQQIEPVSGPVLVIIEGLTMYLTEPDVLQIFSIIEHRFAHAVVYVETMSPWIVSHVKEKSIEGSSARFSWGVQNGLALQPLLPAFHHLMDVSLVEGMKVFMPIYKVLGLLPFVKNISNKILVFKK